jgi:mRNA (guanine-N7-)-methyltransferase
MNYHNKQAKYMRIFHNKIKKILIRQCSPFVDLIFDVGVGRGGDIRKWNHCDIPRAICYDVNEHSINEAKDRFNKSLIDKNYTFKVFQEISDFVKYVNEKSYLVSCQFAIHYFFETETKLNDFFKNINYLLHINGRFIGTFMNGEYIDKLTQGLTKNYSNDAFMVIPRDEIPGEFTRGISVHLANTLYFGDKTVSMEFVVYKDQFEAKAREFGFELESFSDFSDYYDEKVVKFDHNHQICSFSYSTFIFKKVSELN